MHKAYNLKNELMIKIDSLLGKVTMTQGDDEHYHANSLQCQGKLQNFRQINYRLRSVSRSNWVTYSRLYCNLDPKTEKYWGHKLWKFYKLVIIIITYLFIYLLTNLLTYLLTHLINYLLTYLITYILTYSLN
jgi:hypothetical protein